MERDASDLGNLIKAAPARGWGLVRKTYAWDQGAVLDEHTRRKHKVLQEYLFQYISVRCRNPQQRKFRLAIVDGFAGGGRYSCGTPGSPIIIMEQLQRALVAVNARRMAQGLSCVDIECLLLLNDAKRDVVDLLKRNCEPILAWINSESPNLKLSVQYINQNFEESYLLIKRLIQGFPSTLWNLDQYGHSQINVTTIHDIMHAAQSVEIFYTFAIDSLLTFLSRTKPELMAKQVRHLGIDPANLRAIDGIVSSEAWLGAAERIVFEAFRHCAPYVSPFSITNPGGWRYWLIHFANSYRARQVYNDVLHENGVQAHFGLPGLNMLAYDPAKEGMLYLFEREHRALAMDKLLSDIPRFVSTSGNSMSVSDFYAAAYSATPAHKDDIHQAILASGEIEVVTPAGGLRRRINQIAIGDTLRLKSQRSIFTILGQLPES